MSEPLAAEVDFAHYADVLLRRRWILVATWTIVFSTFALYVFTTRPVYEAGAMLVIEKERGGTTAVSADGTVIESSDEDYYQTQYKLLKSQTLLQHVYDELNLSQTLDFHEPGGLQKLTKAVSVVPVLRSRLVYLKSDSHDPTLAMRITNTISNDFIEQNMSSQLFISKEVLRALQNQDETSSEKTFAALPAVVNNTLIMGLKAEYAKQQAVYADLQARYTPKHPAILAVRSSLAALDQQIRSETEKIVQSLKTELSGQLKGNNIRIVDPATLPSQPIWPMKLVTLALGMLAGLMTGIGVAFLVETLDQSIRTQEDVEHRLHLPFLGIVPLSLAKGAPYQALLEEKLSLSSEAIRNLRTMIDFAGVTGKGKTFLLTSSVQNEGKSYTASNLAVAFSQLGEKVLLINGDLRRPTLSKLFSVTSERGLSDFLASSKSVEDLPEFICTTDVPNVLVLPCGPRPPNPSELLNTPKIPALIAWAKANFDRIIVDSTPMFPISDTLLWGRAINSAVFVVRYGDTRPPLILKAKQRLEAGGVKILGVVLNAGTPGGLTYANYGYYYKQYYHSYSQETVAGKRA